VWLGRGVPDRDADSDPKKRQMVSRSLTPLQLLICPNDSPRGEDHIPSRGVYHQPGRAKGRRRQVASGCGSRLGPPSHPPPALGGPLNAWLAVRVQAKNCYSGLLSLPDDQGERQIWLEPRFVIGCTACAAPARAIAT
jgi:hypothetical protein